MYQVLPPALMPGMFATDTELPSPATTAVPPCGVSTLVMVMAGVGADRMTELITELPFGVSFVYSAWAHVPDSPAGVAMDDIERLKTFWGAAVPGAAYTPSIIASAYRITLRNFFMNELPLENAMARKFCGHRRSRQPPFAARAKCAAKYIRVRSRSGASIHRRNIPVIRRYGTEPFGPAALCDAYTRAPK